MRTVLMAVLLGALGASVWAGVGLGASPPPAPSISAFPANPTNATSASFTYTDSAVITKFQCSLDGGSFADCGTTKPSTKSYTTPALAAGSHTFQVRAVSTSGTSSPTSYSWLIDRTAPTVLSINRAGLSPTNAASVAWTVTFSEPVTGVAANGSNFSLVAVGLTGSPAVTGASGSGATYTLTASTGTGTSGSTNTLQARLSSAGLIKDLAGNALAGSLPVNGQTYVIDKTAPNAPFLLLPLLNPPFGWPSTTVFFLFADSSPDVVSFQCSLDGAAFSVCTDPQTYYGVAPGAHTFQAKALDVAGNVSAASSLATFFVDIAAPNTPTLTQTPTNPSSSTSATFAWTDTDPAPGTGVALYLCKLDGGFWLPCSSPKTYTGLSLSSHTFSVVAVDWAANISQARNYTWTVSTTTTGLPFTIGVANATGLLYPGGQDVKLNLSFTNPNIGSPITVTALTITVTGTNNALCPLSLAAVTVSQGFTGPVGPIPGNNVPTSLSDLGVPQANWPKLHMADNGNQNNCKGIQVNVSFSNGQANG